MVSQPESRDVDRDHERRQMDGKSLGFRENVRNTGHSVSTTISKRREMSTGDSGRARGNDSERRRREDVRSSMASSGVDIIDPVYSSDAHRRLPQQRFHPSNIIGGRESLSAYDARRRLSTAERTSYRGSGNSHGGSAGGWTSPTRSGSARPTMPHMAGHALPRAFGGSGNHACGNNSGAAGYSLESSWGSLASSATAGCLLGGRIRPLDGSRGESLQRSLEEAMQVSERSRQKMVGVAVKPEDSS